MYIQLAVEQSNFSGVQVNSAQAILSSVTYLLGAHKYIDNTLDCVDVLL